MYHSVVRSKLQKTFDSLNVEDYAPVLDSLARLRACLLRRSRARRRSLQPRRHAALVRPPASRLAEAEIHRGSDRGFGLAMEHRRLRGVARFGSNSRRAGFQQSGRSCPGPQLGKGRQRQNILRYESLVGGLAAECRTRRSRGRGPADRRANGACAQGRNGGVTRQAQALSSPSRGRAEHRGRGTCRTIGAISIRSIPSSGPIGRSKNARLSTGYGATFPRKRGEGVHAQ